MSLPAVPDMLDSEVGSGRCAASQIMFPRAWGEAEVNSGRCSVPLPSISATGTSGLLGLSKAGNSFANWSFAISLGVYGFDHGGATAVGIVALVRLAPGALASPFAGLLSDRFSRRVGPDLELARGRRRCWPPPPASPRFDGPRG